MLTGLEVLLEDVTTLHKKQVALLTNPTGVTSVLQQNVAALRAAGVNVVTLFSPEHGFGGAAAAGEKVSSSTFGDTGIPIHSLYGETRKPTREMLVNIDVLLYDLQDVGVRFYTYTATLILAMQACAECEVALMVLDRPNPIRADIVEGPVMLPEFESFLGYGAIPLRYGLTIGELARFYAQASGFDNLTVIAMRGWQRDHWYDNTGCVWVAPSPNMPHAHTAALYPGMGLAGEGASYSIGAATPLPFERIGAPWVNGDHLATRLNAINIPGVRFRPTSFTPTAPQYAFAHELCHGVQVHVTNRNVLRSVTLGLHIIACLKALYPERWVWKADHFDRLMGNDATRMQIDAGMPVADIVASWRPMQDAYLERARSCQLY